MATSYIYRGIDQLKGPLSGNPLANPLHIVRITVNVSGTYATGGANVDVAAAFAGLASQTFPLGSRNGVTAINVRWAAAGGDYYDGTTSASPEILTLSSGGTVSPISGASTNNLVLVKLYSGTNGVGGSEIANATALSGDFGLIVGVELTFGGAGAQ